ncbi:DUF805 domain-containing protein [Lactobacillus ultunensis]|uniref:DUF805 domain-containing protein n=1 Tax=Lactobacillus ultunensis DSM 16047 TaxID=525365 RepID=C2EQ48_9LACO|nr:DUF805 domain-containing protein [Lactobacillus ultunensis]EEJ71335.1 hypothetical protein HMPREF0548_1794 [Lactobacillus ultunensis DSM 16047]QQP28658.1 DUF805 domain-containing protein [Lactobacillus ultunensis]
MNNRVYYFIKSYDENLPMPPAESFVQILNETYLHPFDWKARTTRKSFWWSVLINPIISILCIILSFYAFNENINPGIRVIDGVIALAVYIWIFLAGLGQTVRRLHDVGYSGYWYWAAFTGYGAMFLFYLELQPSAQRKVKWGQYLFSNQDYPQGHEDKVPVPTIGQILKEHFFDCFKWNARSTRTSFWVGTAFSQVIMSISILFIYLFSFLFAFIPSPIVNEHIPTAVAIAFLCFLILVLIITIWAFLAQLGHTVRRLHDAGFSGGWWWLSIIPYLGDLLLAFLLFHPTTKSDVKWDKYLFEPEDRIR